MKAQEATLGIYSNAVSVVLPRSVGGGMQRNYMLAL